MKRIVLSLFGMSILLSICLSLQFVEGKAVSAAPQQQMTSSVTATDTICPSQFEGIAIAGATFVFVTGEPGTAVRVTDLTDGVVLGEDIFLVVPNHACEGLADFSGAPGDTNTLTPPLIVGHSIIAENLNNGTFDTTIVQSGSVTSTPTATPTPAGPFIDLLPDCGDPPSSTFTIVGDNWPTDEDLFLYWHDPIIGPEFIDFIGAPHSSSFMLQWTRPVATNNTYIVEVASNPSYPLPGIQKAFTVPCPLLPLEKDLVMVDAPILISTPPIVAYQPVQFNVTISNASNVDITQTFSIDIFIDPGIPIPPGTISIPLTLSDGHTALSNMPANSSQVLTITAPLGFENTPENHLVYGMVDSVEEIDESKEDNNISMPLPIGGTTPEATPTPSPTPGGSDSISGIVRVLLDNWIPAHRAVVTLIDSSSDSVAQVLTDENGFYQFIGVTPDVYTITAYYEIDGTCYFGVRTGITPTAALINIFMLPVSCQQSGADLIISLPQLVTEPPIVAYQPVTFTVTITNMGSVDVQVPFSVDIFIDPEVPIMPGTISIPIELSDGTAVVNSLAAGASQVVTITAPLGYENVPETHLVYSMVDSLSQIPETREDNNIAPWDDVIPEETDLLAIYVLAYDNPPTSTKNLTLYYSTTIQGLEAASLNEPGKTAVILADLDQENDTHILIIHNGLVTPVVGLPDVNGYLTSTIGEYDMSDGSTLGGFLLWVQAHFLAEKTIFSFIGHGAPLAPETDLSAIFTDTLSMDDHPMFPSHYGANADFTDYHSQSIISPYDLALALKIATNNGQMPIDVLDLVHCFALTIEQVHELAPYAETITGTPNYAYFDPTMIGAALTVITSTLPTPLLADAIVQTYDVTLPELMHPRILVALDSSAITAVKDAWDHTAYYLLQSYQQDPTDTQSKIANAYQNSDKYDTSFCEVDWALAPPDALSDMSTFAEQLALEFGANSDIGTWATNTAQAVQAAVLSSYVRNGQPWFDDEPPIVNWEFMGSGLALYTDFQMVGIGDENYLNWQAYWYTDTVRSDNPHPYTFLQGGYNGVTWADVFARYWQGTDVGSAVCTPSFPPVGGPGELAVTEIYLSADPVLVNRPIMLSAEISSLQEAINPTIKFEIYQNGQLIYMTLVGAGWLLPGSQTITANQPWLPEAIGSFSVTATIDVDGRFWEGNETDNQGLFVGDVRNPIYLPFIYQPEQATIITLKERPFIIGEGY